jgi:hypothetical protein
MNREDGFFLSKSWKFLIFTMKECKQTLAKDMAHTSLYPSSAYGRHEDFPSWLSP